MKWLKKFTKWFSESNRWKHFVYAIPFGIISIYLALGLAIGMEFKDHISGGKWDWIDWCCTVIGGMIGQIVTILLLSL